MSEKETGCCSKQYALTLNDGMLSWTKPGDTKVLPPKSVCRVSKMADSVCFAVETVDKLYALKAQSFEARDAWVDWICKTLNVPLTQSTYKGKYVFIVLDKSLPPKSLVLAKTQAILEKRLGFSVTDCSAALTSYQQGNLNRIKGLEFNLMERNRSSSTDTEVEQRLKQRIQILEADIQAVHKVREAVCDVRAQLDEEHHKLDILKKKADEYYRKALQDVNLQKTLKVEIQFGLANGQYMQSLLQYNLKPNLTLGKQARLDALKHGFVCHCCLLDSMEPKPDLGLYKKRQVSVSQDGLILQMKSISLLSPQKTYLELESIHSVLEGTESVDLEPYEGMLYMTVMAATSVYILAVEPRFGFYLEAIQELFFDINNFPTPPISSTSRTVLEGTLHQLKQHQLLYANFYDHWKATQKEGICREIPEVSDIEAKRVSALAQIATVAFSGWNLEEYLRFERQELLKIEDSLNCHLATMEQPTLLAEN